MLYGIDFGRPVGVDWAQTGRALGARWAQVVVWGAAGGCLGAAGGCLGAAGEGSGEGKPEARGNISAWEG